MNELKLFTNAEFGNIRTIINDNEVYFVGKDVAEILGYVDTNKAIAMHVDDDDKLNDKTASSLGQRGGWLINESGLYSLVLSSKLPSAKRFKKWVTSEVLPSIRNHGIYGTQETIDKMLNEPDFGIQLLTRLKEERIARKKLEAETIQLAEKVSQLEPKANYVDVILQSNSTVLVTQIAQDYGYSAKKFNKLLNQLGIQHKVADQWILYGKYLSCGYVHSKTINITRSDGRPDVKMQTEWTQKGRLFLYNTLKENNILPLIEKEI